MKGLLTFYQSKIVGENASMLVFQIFFCCVPLNSQGILVHCLALSFYVQIDFSFFWGGGEVWSAAREEKSEKKMA